MGKFCAASTESYEVPYHDRLAITTKQEHNLEESQFIIHKLDSQVVEQLPFLLATNDAANKPSKRARSQSLAVRADGRTVP